MASYKMKTSFLWSILSVCIAVANAQPVGVGWTERQVYAVPFGQNDSIVVLDAFFAPDKYPAISNQNSVSKVYINDLEKTWDDEAVELPANMNPRILMRLKSVQEYSLSIDIFRKYLSNYLFYQSFGSAFIVPDFEKPASELKISDADFDSPLIEYCGLSEKNGLLPVFFSYQLNPQKIKWGGTWLFFPEKLNRDERSADNIGLVSAETGELQKLGKWKNDAGNTMSGPIAWLNDDNLIMIRYTRTTTDWAIFDIRKKKVVREGNFDLYEEDAPFARDFIIQHGRLYAIFPDKTVSLLYPFDREEMIDGGN